LSAEPGLLEDHAKGIILTFTFDPYGPPSRVTREEFGETVNIVEVLASKAGDSNVRWRSLNEALVEALSPTLRILMHAATLATVHENGSESEL